ERRLLGRVEALLELLERPGELLGKLVRQVAALGDLLVDAPLRAQVLAELVLEPRDVRYRDVVEEAVDARVDRHHLLLHPPRCVLRLVERWGNPPPAGPPR